MNSNNRPISFFLAIVVALMMAYGVLVPYVVVRRYASISDIDGSISDPKKKNASSSSFSNSSSSSSSGLLRIESASASAVVVNVDEPEDDRKENERDDENGLCVSTKTTKGDGGDGDGGDGDGGNDLRDLLDSTTSVLVLGAAKSAGTAFIRFSDRCTGTVTSESGIGRMHKDWTTDLTKTYEIKPVHAQHVLYPQFLEYAANGASRRTLLIWMHREETGRVLSGIRMVLKRRCLDFDDEFNYDWGFELLHRSKRKCTISEDDLIRHLIQKRALEIGWGNERILTCGVYDALTDNAPTMIFADYRRSDEIMKEIAMRHCPEILPTLPLRSNVKGGTAGGGSYKQQQQQQEEAEQDVGVKLGPENGDRRVDLDEWLDAKKDFLEMMVRLKSDMSCQSTTRRMEDAMDSCGDGGGGGGGGTIRLDRSWIVG